MLWYNNDFSSLKLAIFGETWVHWERGEWLLLLVVASSKNNCGSQGIVVWGGNLLLTTKTNWIMLTIVRIVSSIGIAESWRCWSRTLLAIETASNGLSVRPMPNGLAQRRERGVCRSILKNWRVPTKFWCLILKREWSGWSKRGRRDDLFDANKFFSTVDCPTRPMANPHQSHTKMRTNHQFTIWANQI